MRPGDLLVLLLAAVLVSYLYLAFWGPGTAGEYAVIHANGREWQKVSLHEDHKWQVPGPLGVSTLEVRGGRIRFSDSPCQNKACIHAGWLSHGGEAAACLPNRISVQVIGRDRRYDSISF